MPRESLYVAFGNGAIGSRLGTARLVSAMETLLAAGDVRVEDRPDMMTFTFNAGNWDNMVEVRVPWSVVNAIDPDSRRSSRDDPAGYAYCLLLKAAAWEAQDPEPGELVEGHMRDRWFGRMEAMRQSADRMYQEWRLASSADAATYERT